MDERLQELWDHHEIRQLLATYCHGCDRLDEPLMASTYAEDSWDDHGPNKMPGKQFARRILDQARRTSTLVSHQLGQSLLHVDGDEARAETYFIATSMSPPDRAGGPEVMNQLGGRYVDTLVREDGAWLIRHRVCVREWSNTQPIARDWLAGSGFVESRRGPGDVGSAALGLVGEAAA